MARRIRSKASKHWSLAMLVAAAFVFATACGSDRAGPGGGSDTGANPDVGTDTGNYPDVAPAGVPTSLETTVSSKPTVGSPLEVDCKFLNANGKQIAPPSEPDIDLVYSPDDKFRENDANEPVPVETGEAEVACSAPGLSLVDDTPELFTIAPGPPHTVRTTLDNNKVTAGTTVKASCEVWDEYDNPIEDADPEIEVDAMGAGIDVDGHEVTIEKADLYQVTCTVDGAKEENGASLEVNPALPAQLAMDPVPDKSVYAVGEVVRFDTIVTDEYGNEVRQAKIAYGVQPSATPFGTGRWEFNAEGTYKITGTVQGQTKGGKMLSETETIVVNSEGPDISCSSPSDGAMVDRKPSGNITFKGSVSDAHGTSKLDVNGSTVSVGSGGSFSTKLPVDFGVNFVDITATDQYGAENSKTCAFLVADNWDKQKDYMSDSVALELRQKALDDGVHSSLLDSIADVVDQVLNSTQLLVDLDGALTNANPLVKDKCFVSALGLCLVRGDIYYIRNPEGSGAPGSGIETGTNTISMNWISGGMGLSTTLGEGSNDDVRLHLEFRTNTCGDFKGWLELTKLDASLDVDIGLQNGNLSASLRPNSTSVNSGTVTPDFGSVCGDLAGLLKGILQNTYQSTVEDAIKSQLENTLPSLLNSLFSSLDVSALNSTFSVPELDGSGSVPLDFNVRFSRADISSSRGILGVATKFTPGSTEVATPSKGVPLPNGKAYLDPNVSSKAVGASVYIGVLNHVLHALWRGGLFDEKIGSSLLGSSVPTGTSADLSVDLPPVARLNSSGDVELMIGSAELKLVYPGIFDDPVTFDVGLRATSGVKLKSGDKLKFKNIKITDFYFTPQGTSLSAKSRSIIESFLKNLFQGVIDRSLNKGLPALPIPSFTITSSLSKYGLPQGQALGLTGPSLSTKPYHFILKGNFGKK